jgi:hypothetical protein
MSGNNGGMMMGFAVLYPPNFPLAGTDTMMWGYNSKSYASGVLFLLCHKYLLLLTLPQQGHCPRRAINW